MSMLYQLHAFMRHVFNGSNGSNGVNDGTADVPLNTLIQGRCAYIEVLCLPLNRNGNCTAIDVAQMLRS